MSHLLINAYDSITKPKVTSTLSINDWFEKIKYSDFSEQIQQARAGKLDYDSTKASIPCVTYNFLFRDYKKDSNIIISSGLLYIDIDHPSFQIESLDLNKVYSYYHSFGGVGYSIIVKASGITQDNFSSTYEHVVNELGLSEYVDANAIKASQFNVLSYDTNIYVNENAYTFSSVPPPSYVIRKKEEAYTIDGGEKSQRLRFNNLDEIPIDGDYAVNWDGYDTIKCFIPIKKVTKNRNNMLLSYCNNLVWLNPHLSQEKALQILRAVNEIACEPKVDERQLNSVLKSVYTYQEDGSLAPIYSSKKRKIVFASDCKWSRMEKLEACRQELSKRWSDKSLEKLYGIFETWAFDNWGTITQEKTYKLHPISKKTVEKYWKHFKEYVKLLNEEHQKNG